MIITFGGHNGSGKSTISRRVALELGYEWVGMGEFFREFAQQRGVTLAEAENLLKDDDSLDREVDEKVRLLGVERDDIVIDARAAWHFVPHSVKVFLAASPKARAERAFTGRRAQEDYADAEEAGRKIDARMRRFNERLKALYGIDIFEPENFDIVIDTSEITEDEVVTKVMERIAQL